MFVGIGVGIGRNRFAQGIFNAYNLRVVADGGITEAGTCVDAVSSLLQSASLLLIPSGYKGGKLYAEIPTNGNGDLTWTRGGDAFRTNASGVLQRVPWNLLSYSEQFSNAYWTKSNTTISIDTTTAPNGTLTADTLIEDTTNSTHRIFNNSAVTVSNTIATTYSVYLKSAGRTRAWVRDNDITGALFNLSNGTIVTTEGTATATITNVGDGWYRCTITKVSSSVSGRIVVYLDNGTSDTYTGNGTSGIFIWGAQLVDGTTAQTYLPTTDRLNFPRLSYMYGSCPSALLEPQRTNLALRSEEFDNASWTKDSSATVTANTTTAPDGNTTADTINLAAVANSRINQVININNSTTYTVSGYFKNIALASGENISLIYGNTNSFGPPNNFTATASIDLFNGTATYSLTGTSGTGFSGSASGSIQNVGNGWFRVSLTFTTGTAAATGGVFRLISSTVASARSFYAWGMQMEQGAYPTTYIPTTSATATRVADSFSRSNIYTNGLISASGGTWFVELRNNVAYTRDGSGFLGIGDTSALTTNSLVIFCPSTSSRLQIAKFIATVGTTLYTTTTDTVKIAVKWNGTSADVFANGTKVVSATLFTTTNMEFLQSSIQVTTFIQQMALFNSPLTDAQCQTLTT